MGHTPVFEEVAVHTWCLLCARAPCQVPQSTVMQRFALSQLGQTVSDEWDSREIRQELGGMSIAGGPLWVKARW